MYRITINIFLLTIVSVGSKDWYPGLPCHIWIMILQDLLAPTAREWYSNHRVWKVQCGQNCLDGEFSRLAKKKDNNRNQLDGGTLDGSALAVKSDVVHQDDHQPPTPHQHHIEQSDKPRCGSMCCISDFLLFWLIFFNVVAAEFIAKGYSLSDHILTRAIEIDSKLWRFLGLYTPMTRVR